MSRNRGKPTIREISYSKPTPEEKSLLSDAAIKGEPIVTAIIGAALIELELDTLLRQRFPKITDSTWETMVRENGPFSTFDQKITAAFAFRIFDEATKENLKIVKNIRNVFAHAKTLVKFEHELVVKELNKIQVPGFRKVIHRKLQKPKSPPQIRYILLCMVISTHLVRKYAHALQAQNTRRRRKQLSPLARVLIRTADLQSNALKSNRLLSPQSQNAGPNHPTPEGWLSGFLPFLDNPGVTTRTPLVLQEAEKESKKK